jgi:hypothetical protein
MFANDVKIRGNDTVFADDESRSSAAFPSQAVHAFDDHYRGFDQLGEFFEILGVALGQFKFRERSGVVVFAGKRTNKAKKKAA